MQATPLPPAVPLGKPFIVPDLQIIPPVIKGPKWEPVPIYVEDIPEEAEDPNASTKEKEEEGSKETKVKDTPVSVPIPEMAEIQTVTLPLVNVEIPLPRTEILVVASTTAGVSSVTAVAGTLLATSMFRQLQPILKPIFKTIAKKVATIRKKKPPLSFGRQRLKDRYLRQKR